MAKQPKPKLVVVDGREMVNRDWMVERTGAKRVTVDLWYAKRNEQPEDARHPEKGPKIDREDFYDKEQFEVFYAGLQERKKQRVRAASPDLYEGDVEELVSINEAARLLGLSDAGAIRKYMRLENNPGYFPAPAGTVEGPSGRPIPAFRRGDLQDWDRKRTGDTTGAAGAPAGRSRPRPRQSETLKRVETALARLKEVGGYRRGVAAELADEHGEPAWKWERAVKEARNRLSANPK